MTARFSIETAAAPGAVGVIRLRACVGEDLFGPLGCAPVALGDARVRRLFGVDEVLIARDADSSLLLMPHGGPAIMRTIADRLIASGVRADDEAPRNLQDRLEDALARAASPLAVDLLLDQPRRWREIGDRGGVADGTTLARLLTPPVVVAVGAANIGKSSLLNALAGRDAALAFDRPGTTRDTVGAMLDCAGLVVRWIDTPGRDGPGSEAVIDAAVRSADLVVRCRDAGACDSGTALPAGVPAGVRTLEVITRSDRCADAGGGIRTSAAERSGLGPLVRAIREALVPDIALDDPRPWRFWGSGAA